MSNTDKDVMQHAQCHRPDCQTVLLEIDPEIKHLGGFSVKRLLPSEHRQMVGPWIFFDHMGPATFSKGQEGVNVRPHPHIHLATVTYLFEGEIWHRDSLGSDQVITPGDINLMVAGAGIVHSERERPEVVATNRKVHGLQLWYALPKAQESMDPAFYHYAKEQLPSEDLDGGSLRVMMGKLHGLESPVKSFANTLYADMKLDQQANYTLHIEEDEAAIYVVDGVVRVDDVSVVASQMVVLDTHKPIQLHANEVVHLVIIGGASFSSRLIRWNFVSSSKEAIEQATQDWVDGKFPKVPGDEDEYIPYPGQKH